MSGVRNVLPSSETLVKRAGSHQHKDMCEKAILENERQNLGGGTE
jgi:hypothetical protein